MKKLLEHKSHLLLLLISIIFFGCGTKEKSDKVSTNSDRVEESVASFEDIGDKIKFIENKIDKNSDKIENIKTNISKINKQVDERTATPAGLFFFLIIINIIIIIVGFLLILFLKRKTSKNRNKRTNQSNEKNNLEKKVEKLSNQIWELEKNLNSANRKIKSLENKKMQKTPTVINGERDANSSLKETEPTVNNKQPTKYLSGFNGKSFTNVDTTPDGSFFVIKNQKGDTAEYTFHGSDEEAIAKRVFDEQISKTLSGSQKSAKKVEVVTPGKIKLVNNTWEVTNPIEIKLI